MPRAKNFTRSKPARRPQMGGRPPSGDKTSEQKSSGTRSQVAFARAEGVDSLLAERILADRLRSIEQTVANGLRVIGQLSADMNKKQHADGVRAGKRLAKGKSEFAKAHGGQKILDDIQALQYVDFVDGSGIALGAAANQFRSQVIEAWKELDLIDKIPSADALMRLYKRVKTGKRTIDDRSRQAYELLKGGCRDT